MRFDLTPPLKKKGGHSSVPPSGIEKNAPLSGRALKKTCIDNELSSHSMQAISGGKVERLVDGLISYWLV